MTLTLYLLLKPTFLLLGAAAVHRFASVLCNNVACNVGCPYQEPSSVPLQNPQSWRLHSPCLQAPEGLHITRCP